MAGLDKTVIRPHTLSDRCIDNKWIEKVHLIQTKKLESHCHRYLSMEYVFSVSFFRYLSKSSNGEKGKLIFVYQQVHTHFCSY